MPCRFTPTGLSCISGGRRQLLDLLLHEPQSVNSLAAHFDMAPLNARQLEPVSDWLSPYEKFWRGTLKDLRNHLEKN